MKNQEIIKALNWRYAVKTFDPNKKVSDADLAAILESGRLAPSTIGLEPWKFIVVENPGLRAKIRAVSWDQTKVTDASHLVVIARRTDAPSLPGELITRTAKAQGKQESDLAGLKAMAEGGIAAFAGNPAVMDRWLAGQTYIPLGIMIETAALMGIDTGPMEGFDSKKVDEILGLEKENLASTTMLAVGYRGDDSYASLPKARRSTNEVIEVRS